MRKFLLSILVVSCVSVGWCADPPVFEINDFTGGIQNNLDSTLIPNNAVQDARNVYFDEDTIITKRKGMSRSNTTAIGDGKNIASQYEYKMSDGTRYHIAHSSTNLYYRQAGSEFTAFTHTVSTVTPCNYAVFMDTLNYCDGTTTTDLSAWQGNSTWQQNTTYQPKFLLTWQDRLWQAGDSNEPSYLRSCGWLNPKDWTTTVNLATSPVSIPINSQDGQDITGLFASPNGNLGILKEKSVWEIGGYDRDDFYKRLVSPDLGCIDSGSYVVKDGLAIWLSHRGYVAYDGNRLSIISDNIYADIVNIQQFQDNSGQLLKNSQTEWENYTSTKIINTTSFPGSITLDILESDNSRNWYRALDVIQDTTTANYLIAESGAEPSYVVYYATNNAFGTTETIDTATQIYSYQSQSKRFFKSDGNKIYVGYMNHLPITTYGNGYEIKVATKDISGTTWSKTTLDTGDVFTYLDRVNLPIDSAWVSIDLDSSNNLYASYNRNKASANAAHLKIGKLTGSTWSNVVIATATYNGSNLFDVSYARGSMDIDSSDILHIAYVYRYRTGFSPGGDKSYRIFYASNTAGSASYPVQELVGVTVAEIAEIDIQVDSSDYAHIIYLQRNSAPDGLLKHMYYTGSAWVTETIATVADYANTRISIAIDASDNINVMYAEEERLVGKIYVAQKTGNAGSWFVHEFAVAGIQPSAAGLAIGKNDYPIMVYGTDAGGVLKLRKETTGYYVSEAFDTGIDTGTYNALILEKSAMDEINIVHAIKSSSSVAGLAGESWSTITQESIPSTTMRRYLQYKVTIATDTVANVGTLDKVLIKFSTLAGSQRLSSMSYADRVWQAVSVSSSTVLDRILVYDTNNAWTEFNSSIHCTSLLNYNGTPYLGSSDGYVYTLDTTDSDNGAAINAYVRTKDYDLGSIVTEKSLNSMYLAALESGNWNLNVDYYLDKSPTYKETFAIDLDQMANFINYKLPLTTSQRFYLINFKIYNINANEPFDFLGLYSTYKGYPLR